MRFVSVCIMTGLGFTLGLLCSLMLQLPAHNLPANVHDNNIAISANRDDPGFRSRRSFSAAVGDTPEWSANKQWAVGEDGGAKPPSGGKDWFQSAPNPAIASNPFVSGTEADNNGGPVVVRSPSRFSGRRTGGVEGGNRAVKVDERGKTGVKGYVNNNKNNNNNNNNNNKPLSATPATNSPVKSFTLRLKNTGNKFVVDSAVKRPLEDTPVKNDPSRVQTAHGTREKTSLKELTNRTLSDIVTGVLWSRQLEDACPKGFQPQEVASWRRKAAKMQVVRVEEGCGRMQNRLVTFTDGSQACARYRFNTDQIQGEVYSYYLAHLLNITHLPPALLLPVDTLGLQWRGVHLELSMAQWADGRLVILNRWLDHLIPAYIPQELREEDRKLHPTWAILGGKSVADLCDLLQWSDLIIFDYLTANLDRLVNNMFNRQWNAEMMNNPAHNLERTKSGSLVFLDNESGLFHGYRLLEKYHNYHEALLSALCVFRDSTVKAVKALHRSRSVGQELHKLFTEGEVHHKLLPYIPEKNLSVLKDRLARVHDQIVKCEAMYVPR